MKRESATKSLTRDADQLCRRFGKGSRKIWLKARAISKLARVFQLPQPRLHSHSIRMKLLSLLVVVAFVAAHSARDLPHNGKSGTIASGGPLNGHDHVQDTGPRTVIRETTLYYGGKAPSPTSNGESTPTTPATPTPNLITSLGHLKPIFDYGLHHPLKFILNHVFPTLFHLITRLAVLLYSYILMPLLRLIASPFVSLSRPFIALYHSTILRYLFVGLVLGALGGAATAYGSQFGVNILVDKTDKLANGIKEIGARFERIPIRNNEKGKGRERMNGGSHWNTYGSGFTGLDDGSEEEGDVIDRAEEEMRPVKITNLFNRGADMVGGAFASAIQGGTVPTKRRTAGRR